MKTFFSALATVVAAAAVYLANSALNRVSQLEDEIRRIQLAQPLQGGAERVRFETKYVAVGTPQDNDTMEKPHPRPELEAAEAAASLQATFDEGPRDLKTRDEFIRDVKEHLLGQLEVQSAECSTTTCELIVISPSRDNHENGQFLNRAIREAGYHDGLVELAYSEGTDSSNITAYVRVRN